jgi:hypothetical protein
MVAAVPVQISQCHLNYATSGGPLILWSAPGALHITFSDAAQKAATEIKFRITLANQQEVVQDVGTFSPGASVDHTFDVFHHYRAGASMPQPSCAVIFVKFADGTEWSAPPSE